MKKLLILLLSGGYFFLMGWIPDPIPLLDEGAALAIFIKTLNDILKERRLKRTGQKASFRDANDPIIEID